MDSLVQGENVLAVEVHNYNRNSPDIVFGTALNYNRTAPAMPQLYILCSGNEATLYWNGSGFTLQKTSGFSSSQAWTDVPGPVTTSPARVRYKNQIRPPAIAMARIKGGNIYGGTSIGQYLAQPKSFTANEVVWLVHGDLILNASQLK